MCAAWWPTLLSLHAAWVDTDSLTYTHGYLVAGICVLLIARELQFLRGPLRVQPALLPLLAAASLVSIVAARAGIELIPQLLLPAIAWLAICAMTGLREGRRFAFACAYLVFAIPVWDLVNGLLQGLSVAAVKAMLGISGIAAFVDGNVVHIPEGTFAVEGGCSGLHYLIVAVSIMALFGEIHRDSLRVRLKLVALAVGFALLSNWVRIYVVVVAGHLTDMRHYLVSVSHYGFGWALFAVSMLLLLWLASRFAPQVARPPVTHAPQERVEVTAGWKASGASVAVAALGPLIALLFPVRPAQPLNSPLLPALAGWDGPRQVDSDWRPTYADSDRRQLAGYFSQGRALQAFIAEYDEQRQGKEIIGYGRSLISGLDGEAGTSGTLEMPGGAARWIQIGAGGEPRSLVLYYYAIGKTQRVQPLAAQLTYALASFGGAVRSRVVAVRATCAATCDAATEDARRLLAQLTVTGEEASQ